MGLYDNEGPVVGEQIAQLTKYTRSHSGGGQIEVFTFTAASKGKVEAKCWIKNFLSEGKEDLYVRALKNLYRKLDFIELNQALEMEDITDEEYDKELTLNENSYLIPSHEEQPTVQQVIQVADIVKRIGRVEKMSVDDVSEIFTLDMGKAENVLQTGNLALEM